jgi:hypothetical protein
MRYNKTWNTKSNQSKQQPAIKFNQPIGTALIKESVKLIMMHYQKCSTISQINWSGNQWSISNQSTWCCAYWGVDNKKCYDKPNQL